MSTSGLQEPLRRFINCRSRCCGLPLAGTLRRAQSRGLWSRLLSPAQAFLEERGDLEEEQALPGECYSSHPLWEEVCCVLPFQQFGKIIKVGKRRHINVGEVRAAIRGEEGVGRRRPRCRYVHLQDSQVNFELRRSIPGYLSSRVRPSFGFIRSKLNPSDDPTRSCEMRKPSRDPPPGSPPLFRGTSVLLISSCGNKSCTRAARRAS